MIARFGPYTLLAEVGRGAAATVFRARTVAGDVVALKVLDESPRADAAARFGREQRILAALGEESGFVPLLDWGGPPAAPRPFLVMPFVEGGTLRDRLRAGPLTVAATVALGAKLAVALRAAHERGVVHRDLKPENVLFTARGEPLIADFGLARLVSGPPDDRDEALSATGGLLGTISYMAPEQLLDAKRAGPSADIFALGAVLHECLSGMAPFEAATLEEIASKILRGDANALDREDVPRRLAATLRRALARDPGDRFSSAASFANALRGRSGSERPASSLALAALLR